MSIWNRHIVRMALQTSKDNQIYCQQMVQGQDPVRYMTVLFAPEDKRRSLFALYAFHLEIAKIRETVSEPTIGEIRLQWWQESLDGIKDGFSRDHPVYKELEQVADFSVLYPLLSEVITARRSDLYSDGINDFQALIDYVNSAGGALSEAAYIVSMAKASNPNNRRSARSSGAAWAMIGLLRAVCDETQSIPFMQTITDSDPTLKLCQDMYSAAENFYTQAMGAQPKTSPLLLNAVSSVYLRRLLKALKIKPQGSGKANQNTVTIAPISQLSLIWTMTKAALLKRY